MHVQCETPSPQVFVIAVAHDRARRTHAVHPAQRWKGTRKLAGQARAAMLNFYFKGIYDMTC